MKIKALFCILLSFVCASATYSQFCPQPAEIFYHSYDGFGVVTVHLAFK